MKKVKPARRGLLAFGAKILSAHGQPQSGGADIEGFKKIGIFRKRFIDYSAAAGASMPLLNPGGSYMRHDQ